MLPEIPQHNFPVDRASRPGCSSANPMVITPRVGSLMDTPPAVLFPHTPVTSRSAEGSGEKRKHLRAVTGSKPVECEAQGYQGYHVPSFAPRPNGGPPTPPALSPTHGCLGRIALARASTSPPQPPDSFSGEGRCSSPRRRPRWDGPARGLSPGSPGLSRGEARPRRSGPADRSCNQRPCPAPTGSRQLSRL